MIHRIEVDTTDIRQLGSDGNSSTMIGATAHGQTGNENLTLNFSAQLNVTELAKLKTLLDEVETRISGEIGARP